MLELLTESLARSLTCDRELSRAVAQLISVEMSLAPFVLFKFKVLFSFNLPMVEAKRQ